MKLFGVATLSSLLATPALAQALPQASSLDAPLAP
jgi:hypothetical protein